MKDYNGLINVSYPKNPYCIYKIISSDDNDSSIYIGVTTNYIQRATKHASCRFHEKYKDNSLYSWMNDVIDNQNLDVKFEVLARNLSTYYAFELETRIIELCKNIGCNVLNDSDGGKGPKGLVPWNKGKTLSEELCEKLSEAHKGKPSKRRGIHHSEETRKLLSIRGKERTDKGWVSPRRKSIYKYDSSGNLIFTYSCLDEASIHEHVSPITVSRWCRKQRVPRNKFVWSYNELTINK